MANDRMDDHDAHMALATRTTWNTQAQRALAPRPKTPAPKPVWSDRSVVISRRELRAACVLGAVGVLCLAASVAAFFLAHC